MVIAESSPSHYDLGAAASVQAAYYASSGWKNNDLSAAPAVAALSAAELSKPEYLHAVEKAVLKDYGK